MVARLAAKMIVVFLGCSVVSVATCADNSLDLKYKVGLMGLDEFSTTPITLTVTNHSQQPMKNVVLRANQAISMYFKNNKINVGDLKPAESRKVTAYLTAPVLSGDDLAEWNAEYQSRGETVSSKVMVSK